MSDYSSDELMTIAAARRLKNGMSCFVGIGLPSKAANLARLTHAPGLVLIYESGAIGTRPPHLPLSIGDGILATHADCVVPTHEIFRYWLQGGRIDVGFLGAAQIDQYANLNSTVIGDYDNPKVRLPGAGGAPEIAGQTGEVFVIIRQSKRTFVEKVDFITSVGHLDGGDARAKLGLTGGGPTVVVTDIGILEPDRETKALTMTRLHPGKTRKEARDATGWELQFADDLRETRPPAQDELEALRDLQQRSDEAYRQTG